MATNEKKMSSDLEILIVEDSSTQAEYVKHIFEKEGYQVIVADNGRKALELLATRRPTVVISDILMPEMDGFELCSRIKGNELLKNIPVILLTSLSDPADVIKGLESGADNFITKPYEEKYLVNRIRNIVLSREIRKSDKAQLGIEISFAGKKHFINSDRLQILNLLISTYENAVQINQKLRETQQELKELNFHLERKVEERTAKLQQEIAEREKVEKEKVNLQEQLFQAQKMEAIGRLAGGVAHDFNNLLTVIIGYSDIILRKMPEDGAFRSQTEEIRNAGERASSLTRQLLAFSRKQVLQPVIVGLNEIVDRMDKMLRRLIGEDIDLLTHLTPGLHPVMFDPGQIEQIIMNLAVNARDAMPHGGKLTIETANVELDVEYAREHSVARPGPHVMIAVTDTGTGMDATTKAHIFEPFFTTKGLGKGTGLGLSTVYGIVKQSGGNIWVYSELGRGTTFKIHLPRAEEVFVPSKTRPKISTLINGTETILVVEDDESVRRLIRDVLKSSGYTVLDTGDVDEAIEVGKMPDLAIHLLLADLVLPKMDGQQLADRLSFLRPGLKVLYMSGYTDIAIFHNGILDPSTAYIDKPIKPNQLLEKIREVIDVKEDN